MVNSIKRYFKNPKIGGAGIAHSVKTVVAGDVFLTTPENDQANQLAVTEYSSSLDLLCEGPIEGFCDQNGRAVQDLEIFKSIYYNEMPVLQGVDYIDNIVHEGAQSRFGFPKFNFSEASAVIRKGEEFQEEIRGFSEALTTFEINKEVYGKFSINGDARIGEGNQDVRTVLIDSFSSETTDVNYSEWMDNDRTETDEYFYTHEIKRKEVKRISVVLSVPALFDTVQSARAPIEVDGGQVTVLEGGGQASLGSPINTTVTAIVEVGIKGQEPSQQIEFPIRGVVIGEGLTKELPEITLPNSNIERYVRVRKKEAETDSILIERRLIFKEVKEILDANFTYPNCALVGSTISARSFSQPPSRSFDCRLKKIQIPSNYFPLIGGKDSRLVEDQSSLSYVKSLYQFRSGEFGILKGEPIDFSRGDIEISFKCLVPSFSNSVNDVRSFFDKKSILANGLELFPDDIGLRCFDKNSEINFEVFDSSGQALLSAKADTTALASLIGFQKNHIIEVRAKLINNTGSISLITGNNVVSSGNATMPSRGEIVYDNNLVFGADGSFKNGLLDDYIVSNFEVKRNSDTLFNIDGQIDDGEKYKIKDFNGSDYSIDLYTKNAHSVVAITDVDPEEEGELLFENERAKKENFQPFNKQLFKGGQETLGGYRSDHYELYQFGRYPGKSGQSNTFVDNLLFDDSNFLSGGDTASVSGYLLRNNWNKARIPKFDSNSVLLDLTASGEDVCKFIADSDFAKKIKSDTICGVNHHVNIKKTGIRPIGIPADGLPIQDFIDQFSTTTGHSYLRYFEITDGAKGKVTKSVNLFENTLKSRSGKSALFLMGQHANPAISINPLTDKPLIAYWDVSGDEQFNYASGTLAIAELTGDDAFVEDNWDFHVFPRTELGEVSGWGSGKLAYTTEAWSRSGLQQLYDLNDNFFHSNLYDTVRKNPFNHQTEICLTHDRSGKFAVGMTMIDGINTFDTTTLGNVASHSTFHRSHLLRFTGEDVGDSSQYLSNDNLSGQKIFKNNSITFTHENQLVYATKLSPVAAAVIFTGENITNEDSVTIILGQENTFDDKSSYGNVIAKVNPDNKLCFVVVEDEGASNDVLDPPQNGMFYLQQTGSLYASSSIEDAISGSIVKNYGIASLGGFSSNFDYMKSWMIDNDFGNNINRPSLDFIKKGDEYFPCILSAHNGFDLRSSDPNLDFQTRILHFVEPTGENYLARPFSQVLPGVGRTSNYSYQDYSGQSRALSFAAPSGGSQWLCTQSTIQGEERTEPLYSSAGDPAFPYLPLEDKQNGLDKEIRSYSTIRKPYNEVIPQTFLISLPNTQLSPLGYPKTTGDFDTFDLAGKNYAIYRGDWDGSFKTAWSDNPVWIIYDMITNPIYGVRNSIEDIDDVDIFSFYTLGKYCDAVDISGFFEGVSDGNGGLEPRYSYNMIFENNANAFQMINGVASSFFGTTYWKNGTIKMYADQPKQVQAIFNNGNVFDGMFEYKDIYKNERFSLVTVPYADKKDDFKIKKEYIEDENEIRSNGIVLAEEPNRGITSSSQARRHAKRILYSNLLETEIIDFKVDQTALIVEPGDLIQVNDELKSFELNYAKIIDVDVAGNILSIDDAINTGSILTGADGGVFIYGSTGQSGFNQIKDHIEFLNGEFTPELEEDYSRPQAAKISINSITKAVNKVNLHLDPLDENIDYLNVAHVGSFCNIELDNAEPQLFTVVNVIPEENNLYAISAREYNSGKFELIEQQDEIFDIKSVFPNIGIPSNEINRPTPPDGFVFETGFNNLGGVNLEGSITGALAGNETSYRVSLIKSNGSYQEKEIEKDVNNLVGGKPVSLFNFYNLDSVGQYTIQVRSLRNPESSQMLKQSFVLSKNEPTVLNFEKIQILYAKSQSWDKAKRTGTAKITNEDVEFLLNIEDQNGSVVKNANVSIDICENSDWTFLATNINDNRFKTKVGYPAQKYRFSIDNSDFAIFEVSHEQAEIKNINLLNNDQFLNFEVELNGYKSFENLTAFTGNSPIKTQANILSNNFNFLINSEDVDNFTGKAYYKFIGLDKFGNESEFNISEPIEIHKQHYSFAQKLKENSINSIYVAKYENGVLDASSSQNGFRVNGKAIIEISLHPKEENSVCEIKIGDKVYRENSSFYQKKTYIENFDGLKQSVSFEILSGSFREVYLEIKSIKV